MTIRYPVRPSRRSLRGLSGGVALLFSALALIEPGCNSKNSEECGVASPFAPRAMGGACPEGPQQCEWGLGCDLESNQCGVCDSAEECQARDGCRGDGTCGACTSAEECRSTESCREGFCMPTELPVWNLSVDEADWTSLHDYSYLDTEYGCTLTTDEGGVPSVYGACTVRSYGATSRNYDKKSLRIEFPEDSIHPGFTRKINLRAEYNDATFMRTVAGYETLRRLTPLPVPETRHLKLNVNGSYYGLMVEVERLGGHYLEQWGRDRQASLYKSEHASPYGALVPFPDASMYETWEGSAMFDKVTGDDDYSELAFLFEDILWADYMEGEDRASTSVERTVANVDVRPFLESNAVMTLIQNRDHVASNFYLSHQPAADGERYWWEIYPYDVDISFGCVFDEVEINNICDDLISDNWSRNGEFGETEVGYPTEIWGNMLIHLLIRNDACEALYYQEITDKMDSDWWKNRLPSFLEAMRQTISSAAVEDTNDLSGSASEFNQAVDDMEAFLPARTDYLERCLYGNCQ